MVLDLFSDHTPDYSIKVNGLNITFLLKRFITSISISDRAGMRTDSVSIALVDTFGILPLPKFGAKLDISLGYKESFLISMGTFFIDSVSMSGPPNTINVTASGADFSTLRNQKTRAWEEKTIGDIVKKIASEHGYKSSVATSLATVKITHINQTNESDLQFLLRLAKENGAVLKPAAEMLVFVEEGEGAKASGLSMPTISLSPEDVSSWSVELSTQRSFECVKAYWYDRETAKKTMVKAGSGEPIYEIKHQFEDKTRALNAAKSKLDELKLGNDTLSISMPGNPNIGAEYKIKLSGFRSGVNGTWVCQNVTHRISGSGYTTSINARAAL